MTSSASPTGPYAFVFWNDDLTDDGVRAQLVELAAAGFRGVTLSARIGLSRRVGYLTAEYLRLVRLAVDECARLGLAVMLYDEASYPSGSANGGVVGRDPSFAARCLVRVVRDVHGPADTFWRPTIGRSPDQRLLAVVCSPVREGRPVPGEAVLLPVDDLGLVHLDLPTGEWQVCGVFDTQSGGTIRGAFPEQDDGSALAPAAADLLNPAAVAAFVELTHDAYAGALEGHLGSTVVAMFTDEPSLLGRAPRTGAVPYTTGFEDDVAQSLGVDRDEVLRRLPALWDAADDDADPLRRAWTVALRTRLGTVFYGAQAHWCEQHGIALTGHPAEADDLASGVRFHWPGQDTVWRWVLPGDDSGLVGAESTAPKAAASAAHLRGHGTAVAEVLGAYGWQLTLDEAKWLLDWYLSRGVTTLVLHAFFSSVRGNRAYESEPDLGRFTSSWPHLPRLIGYLTRVAELFAGATHTASVAVLANPDRLPHRVARRLFESQVDFFYLDPEHLRGATVEEGRLVVGDQRYAVVVDEHEPRAEVDDASRGRLDALVASGGLVVDAARDWDVARVKAHLRAAGGVVVQALPAAPHLRVVALRDGDRTSYAFFNEGEEPVHAEVSLDAAPRTADWLDPLDGTRRPATTGSGTVTVELERRQTAVLVPREGAPAPDDRRPPAGRTVVLDAWTATPVSGLVTPPVSALGLGDWTRVPAMRRFSGTYRYVTEVELPSDVGDVRLDLGWVGDAATVLVNGTQVTHLMWRPYVTTVGRAHLRPGTNRIELLVSNSAANHYEGADRPSGLMGPVTLVC